MVNHWVRAHFEAGTAVFHEGDLGRDAYLIERGEIHIVIDRGTERRLIATLREGEMFGEIALIDQMPRTASALAAVDTTLIPISRDLILDKLRHSDPLLSHLLEVAVSRFRNTLSGHNPLSEGASLGDESLRHLRQYAVNQLHMAQNLSDALANDELLLHYQPVVHLEDGHLAGFEALIRWNRPDRGFISPLGFIGVAEETGLIVPIGRWVVRTALADLVRFQAAMRARRPDARLFMSVNLSARQLQEPGEVPELIDCVLASGVDPASVKLEVTESALIDHPEQAASWLHEFKRHGLLLAIDDFGTGYSSLSYLGQFPFDTLKIDQSFVATMREKEPSLRITRAIAGLARDLEMDCIAEGVEHPTDLPTLRAIGCEFGQGYHFAKPLNAVQALDYIARKG